MSGSYVNGALTGRPVTVQRDIGGDFHSYVNATERLRASGAPVTVTGSCISGCTLALSLPKSQVRVSPDARFLIHGAYNPNTGAQVEWATRKMVGMYRPEVQAIINRRGGVPPGRAGGPHLHIRGRELIALGWASTDDRNVAGERRVARAATPNARSARAPSRSRQYAAVRRPATENTFFAQLKRLFGFA